MTELRRHVVVPLAAAALALSACGGSGPDTTSPRDGAASPTAVTSPVSGSTVPGTEVEAFDGRTVSLNDYRGSYLVVNFWASWCPPCIAEMPDLEAVHQSVVDEVAFVGINTQDSPEQAADLVEQTGVTYDLVRDPDGRLFREFGVFGMPSTFYVAPDGTILGRHTGLLTRDALLEDIEEHFDIHGTVGG